MKINDIIPGNRFDKERLKVNLFFLKKGTAENIEERYKLFYTDVQGEAVKEIGSIINEYLSDNSSKSFTDYFDYHSDKQYDVFFNKELEIINILKNKIDNFTNLQIFDKLDSKTKALIIEVRFGNERYLFFKIKDLRAVLKKKIITLLMTKGKFDSSVNSSNSLELEPNFDFVYHCNSKSFLISKKSKFESLFDYRAEIKKIILENLTFIKKTITFNEGTEVKLVENGNFMRRILKIIQCDSRFKEIPNLNYAKYKQILENKTDLKFELDKNNKPIINDDIQLNMLLNIFSENYVQEIISEELFEVKDKIKPNSN